MMPIYFQTIISGIFAMSKVQDIRSVSNLLLFLEQSFNRRLDASSFLGRSDRSHGGLIRMRYGFLTAKTTAGWRTTRAVLLRTVNGRQVKADPKTEGLSFLHDISHLCRDIRETTRFKRTEPYKTKYGRISNTSIIINIDKSAA